MQVSHTPGSSATDNSLEECRKIGNNTIGTVERFEDGGHIQDWSKFLKPQGVLKTIIIPIDFPDAPHETTIQSIKKFGQEISGEFSRLSNNTVKLEISTTSSWIRMPHEGKFYLSTIWTQKINDALDAADNEIDFSKFDLVLIKVDERNSPINSAGALPMWGENLGDGVKVLRGAFLGNDYWTKQGQGVQVAVHEISHVFGLPDLYQRNSTGKFQVGIFDLMSTFRLQYELHMLGWNKWKLGWLEEKSLKCLSASNPILLELPIDKSKWSPVFIPFQDRVIGVELWADQKYSSSTYAIIYEVSPKKYVWASNLESGKESPIELLRPTSTAAIVIPDSELNLSAKFSVGDFVESNGLKFHFLAKGKENFYLSVTPVGQSEINIPKENQVIIESPESSSGGPIAKVMKKTTITCIKGKVTKKVTAVKPKCPAGYKKK
jgi:M6 family metalloprotease-like protein